MTMPADPLTAAILMGSTGGGNPAMLDPALMAITPDIQLGQAMQQQGLSTAPASPLQALARVAQAGAGGLMTRGALSDLGKIYAGEASRMAPLFAGTPLGDALASGDPIKQMIAMQQVPKVLAANSLASTLGEGAQRYQGTQPIAQNTQPLSPEGRRVRDANIVAQSGNLPGATAIERGITKETATPEGVQFPPTNVLPSRPVQTQTFRPAGAGPVPMAAIPPPEPRQEETPPANPQFQTPGALDKDQSRVPPSPAIPGMAQSIAGAKGTIAANEQANKNFIEKDTPSFNSAQNLVQRLDIIDHNIAQLGPSWMGAGADTKAELGKAWNSTLDTFGIQGAHVDPAKVATWEDFNKETTRAGMELIKSNFGGSREAASIIQMGRTAVPGVQNTYIGAKYVSATIRAAAQYEIDKYNYKADLQKRGVPISTADAEFAAAHPPGVYAMRAITSQIPPQAVSFLRANPNTAAHFDRQFGPNTAEFILGAR